MVRWWDRWLYQRPGQDLPALRAYIMDGPDAGEGPDHRRGFWVSEAAWPSPNIDSLALHRSEEHTSELQSLMRISYAVFCLKKKKITSNTKLTYTTLNSPYTCILLTTYHLHQYINNIHH